MEEAFAAHAARMTASDSPSALATSIEFPAQERASCGWSSADRMPASRASTNSRCTGRTRPPTSPWPAAARCRAHRPLLPGYAIHAVAHLNDGLYGNDHSWIAATAGEEWAQIELPAPARVARVVISRDRNGKFTDRQILEAEVRLSSDGQTWQTAATLTRAASQLRPAACPR